MLILFLLLPATRASIGGLGGMQERQLMGLLSKLNRTATLPTISKRELTLDTKEFIFDRYITELQMEVRAQEILSRQGLLSGTVRKQWMPKNSRKEGASVPNQTLAVILRTTARHVSKQAMHEDVNGRVFRQKSSFNTTHGAAGHLERLALALVGVADMWVLCARDAENNMRFDGVSCNDYAQVVDAIQQRVPVNVSSDAQNAVFSILVHGMTPPLVVVDSDNDLRRQHGEALLQTHVLGPN
jgi:hypothetical protein